MYDALGLKQVEAKVELFCLVSRCLKIYDG